MSLTSLSLLKLLVLLLLKLSWAPNPNAASFPGLVMVITASSSLTVPPLVATSAVVLASGPVLSHKGVYSLFELLSLLFFSFSLPSEEKKSD